MARQRKATDLATIEARRAALKAELAELDDQTRAAEQAARDAGRPTLIAALDRIKVAALTKGEAKAIADAIALHGGRAVAEHLATYRTA